MKKLLAVTLFSILSLFTAKVNTFSPISPAYAHVDTAVTKEIRGMVGSLRDLKSTKGAEENFCSAIKLNPRIILTAAHCIEEGEKAFFFISPDQLPVYAEVFKKDDKLDLALLKVPFVPGPYAELASGFKQDDFVYAVGYPLSDITKGNQVLTTGLIQGEYYYDPTQILFSAPIIFGNSGGGLFNTKGELVGVTVAGIIMWNGPGHIGHLNMAVRIEEIKKFLS